MPNRHPIEIANLAEVEETISTCVAQGRAMTESMVLGLHTLLLKGLPEEPKRPKKPGKLRDATDKVWANNVEHLTAHMSPAWRVREDLTALLDAAERDALPGERGIEQAARFHYRFVRIHPFCDGNGRMARALSTLLMARENPEVLVLSKPVNVVLWEHREDYVGVLEYCDGQYEELKEEPIAEPDKLRRSEQPFMFFYTMAVAKAYLEEVERLVAGTAEAKEAAAKSSEAEAKLSLGYIKDEFYL